MTNSLPVVRSVKSFSTQHSCSSFFYCRYFVKKRPDMYLTAVFFAFVWIIHAIRRERKKEGEKGRKIEKKMKERDGERERERGERERERERERRRTGREEGEHPAVTAVSRHKGVDEINSDLSLPPSIFPVSKQN